MVHQIGPTDRLPPMIQRAQLVLQPRIIPRVDVPRKIIYTRFDIVLEMMKRAIEEVIPQGCALERVVLVWAQAVQSINASVPISENHGSIPYTNEFGLAHGYIVHQGEFFKGQSRGGSGCLATLPI